MNPEIAVLSLTAASIGLLHTLLGPDHYLPFIVMSKARKWSMSKTAIVTFLCGIGHVFSSVVIGMTGVAFGIGVMKLEALEALRGDLAAWLLIGFGFAYCSWGLHKAFARRPHSHSHAHSDESLHTHKHSHEQEHVHVHAESSGKMTPWILFTIFVFGPCEPLIPILMYPAAKCSIAGMVLVIAVFCLTTIITMMSVVMFSAWGISFARFGVLERYSHAIAGATICLAGLAIQFLGL